MSTTIKLLTIDQDEQTLLNHSQYVNFVDSEYQSHQMINDLTANAPQAVFLNLNDNALPISLLVPANTNYLLVANGSLYACQAEVSFNKKRIKQMLKEIREELDMYWGNGTPNMVEELPLDIIARDEQRIVMQIMQNMNMEDMFGCYVISYEDTSPVKVADLSEGGFIPRLFVLDAYNNAQETKGVGKKILKHEYFPNVQEMWMSPVALED